MTASSEKIEEEADYVNAAVCTAEKTGTTSDHKFLCFTKSFLTLAVCWVTLLIIMSLHIYFTSVMFDNNIKLTAENRQLRTKFDNLTQAYTALESKITNLTAENRQLRTKFDNLTQAYTALESKITNLTAENQNLTIQKKQLEARNQELETRNQELETEKNNLTQKIQEMETKTNELNISRAQWSIDTYCRQKDSTQCKPCQDGWLVQQSSCYVIHDAQPAERRTWDEARSNCKGKISDLVVILNQDEKTYINNHSWGSSGTNGYWIGLRVEDGKWKWVDGTDLTDNSWIQQHPPTDGHCAISVLNEGWKSVNCGDKIMWICKKKAISV